MRIKWRASIILRRHPLLHTSNFIDNKLLDNACLGSSLGMLVKDIMPIDRMGR